MFNIIAAGLAIGSSLLGARSARRAAGAQREANELQRQSMSLEQARQRRETIRAARMARGRAVTSAARQGVMDSSGAQGGMASIQSQLGYNLSFLDQQERINDQASAALGRARMFEGRAQTFGALANLGWTSAQFFEGRD